MYSRSSSIYDALYHFKDYEAASDQIHALLQRTRPEARTLLDVGCGTGKHISLLADRYEVQGVDISPDMLEVAKSRSPGIQFHQADMTEMDLGQRFDVVTSLFSSIAYVKTPERLRKAVARMAHHLKPQGILLVEPWISPDRYRTGSIATNFFDGADQKIAWMYVNAVEGAVSVFDIHYLLGKTGGGVTHFTERHEMGLFTHEEYVAAFEDAGIQVKFDPTGFFGRGLYIGVRDG